MTAFVILAAGRGSRIGRVGEKLHKALVPLGGKAVLSHLIDLAPPHARMIICVGHNAEQIVDYVGLAHPGRIVTFVQVEDWDKPHAGPGASLLAAEFAVGDDDMIFTSCDTLWDRDHRLWHLRTARRSWVGLAPVPAGTPHERWTTCVLDVTHSRVERVHDKVPGRELSDGLEFAWTGLGFIRRADLTEFWSALRAHDPVGELQIIPGLEALSASRLGVEFINWTDVGDEVAYRHAIARFTGYDFVKYGQATYVLPDEGRVVKFNGNPETITHRIHRAVMLDTMVPIPMRAVLTDNLMAHAYVPGVSAYLAIERDGIEVTKRVLDWFHHTVMASRNVVPISATDLAAITNFYMTKTFMRITKLESVELRETAFDAVTKFVDWHDLLSRVVWGVPHGDFNFGNIIVTPGGEFVGIDWRENFGEGVFHGDIRYDLGKMLAGTWVHWERAQWGDFRPWVDGERHAELILDYADDHGIKRNDLRVIAALSLLNSAPLHAAPLSDVLVARGVAQLQAIDVHQDDNDDDRK